MEALGWGMEAILYEVNQVGILSLGTRFHHRFHPDGNESPTVDWRAEPKSHTDGNEGKVFVTSWI